jgi:hypothetical protein
MGFARVLTAASGCVLLGAAVAACSGSFGSGTNSPIPLGSLGPAGAPTSTPASTSSSVILTYGDSDAFQNLPEVGGFSGAVAFPKAPPPTAAPSAKPGKGGASPTPAPAPTGLSIAIGATLYTSKPDDGPDLNFESGTGHARRTREKPARALAYIKLLPTHDVTLESYPKISIDIPRDLASQYRDGEFGIALWNSGEKDAKYRLAVAERDTTSSAPPIIRATAAPAPIASAVATGVPLPVPSPSGMTRVGMEARAAALGGPSGAPLAAPLASATLPPQRLLFAGTATTLHLVANRPAIFALYALPHPGQSTASTAPAAVTRGAEKQPAPHASATSLASPEASPAASGIPSVSPSSATTATSAPSASPVATPPHH